jgi:predicted nucleotidyltransferase
VTHGLNDSAVERIHSVLARYGEVEKAILYGSRAKGNFAPGSDIDLALVGAGLNQALLGLIAQDLDDLLLPWRFDLSLLPRITHADLLDHIRRVGLTLYEKNPYDASN